MTPRIYNVPRLLTLLGIEYEKRGRELHAKCPFHDDRNPSWSIHETLGLYFCFSCGSGGNLVTLTAHVLGLDRQGASQWLSRNGFDEIVLFEPDEVSVTIGGGFVPTNNPKFDDSFWYQETRSVTDVASAWNYAKDRGITEAQADLWAIHAGVCGRLGGRIIFPIHVCKDKKIQMAGYMARTFVGGKPRYLTPPPEAHPDRDAVFGEFVWPTDPSDRQLVVAEGAFNALACERAGAGFIAALGGSNPGLPVFSKIARFGHVLIATDPDSAGEKVATALKVLQRWTEVTRVDLPKGLDANDLSMKELQRRLINAGLRL